MVDVSIHTPRKKGVNEKLNVNYKSVRLCKLPAACFSDISWHSALCIGTDQWHWKQIVQCRMLWIGYLGDVQELDWPAQSSDFNPILYLQDELVGQLHIRPYCPTSVAKLTDALEEIPAAQPVIIGLVWIACQFWGHFTCHGPYILSFLHYI